MGLIALLALGLAIWACSTGKVPKAGDRKTAALVLGGLGLLMLTRARVLPALALLAGGAALWPWRNRPAVGGNMSVEEARALLGIDPAADATAIKAAHRRLIGKYHPDQGGTDALARQINRARDIALSATRNK